MNNKFFVPFKTAQQLREKGYPQESDSFQECDMYYYDDGELEAGIAVDMDDLEDCIYAPTYHEVVDWLEEKGIYITCYAPLLKPVGRYAISVFNSNTNNINDWGLCRDAYPTREKALNEGILKALEML